MTRYWEINIKFIESKGYEKHSYCRSWNDTTCGDLYVVDQCPRDFFNDQDSDKICGDIDKCPFDAENDIDSDRICGDIDKCPYDNVFLTYIMCLASQNVLVCIFNMICNSKSIKKMFSCVGWHFS